MKRTSLVVAIIVAGAFIPADRPAVSGISGVDVSNWTGQVDWAAVADAGAAFAFVHASEGADYRNPLFAAQYGGAAEAGLFRSAYHFAQPHETDGATQADFFVDAGGGWTADSQTLPGVLDVEDNPYRSRNGLDQCYGLDRRQMIEWVGDFTRRYRARTGRDAIIYTTTNWWRTCTGNSAVFGRNPLWLARWGNEPGRLPAGWPRHSFWQAADKGELPGGQNVFNGTVSQLRRLAMPPPEIAATGKASGGHYTVTVLNTGTSPATGITVTGRVVGRQKIVKAWPGCRFTRTAARCAIRELAPGDRTRLSFVTRTLGRSGERRAAGSAGAGRARGLRVTIGTVSLTVTPERRAAGKRPPRKRASAERNPGGQVSVTP